MVVTMGELINTLIVFQKYLVVILLTIMAFYWYSLKSSNKINYAINSLIVSLIFAMGFPFLIDVIDFIPQSLNYLIKGVLFLVLNIALFVSVYISYNENRKERTGYLKEIIDKKKDVPLKLEFVRELINPELKVMKKEQKNLLKAME